MDLKKMVETSILTAAFIVITIIATSIGIGFFGYYDFVVPIFFSYIYIKNGLKYSFMSFLVSFVLLIMLLGNPVLNILLIQGSLVGIVCGIIICKSYNVEEDILYISILCVLSLFIFDFVIRFFTNVSLVSNLGELTKELNSMADYLTRMMISNNIGNGVVDIERIKNLYTQDKVRIAFYLGNMFMSFASAFIIYFYTLFLSKRTKCDLGDKKYKHNLFKILILDRKSTFLNQKVFYILIAYSIIVETLKYTGINIGNEYIRASVFTIQYLSILFIFRDSILILEAKFRKKGKNTKFFRVIIIILLLFLPKIIIWLVIIFGVLGDIKGDYRKWSSYDN